MLPHPVRTPRGDRAARFAPRASAPPRTGREAGAARGVQREDPRAPNLLSALAMRFVELEEARAAPGLRVVIAGGVPSPWSQGALGLFAMRGVRPLVVRFRRAAQEVRAWTGSWDAPVVVYEREPPRTGWAEILSLADRLGDGPPLVPADDDGRVRLFGLAHELLGENGLGWCVRLLLVHASVTTDGREGWPAPVAADLAPKYGYAPERAPAAKARAISILRSFGRLREERAARGDDYLLGDAPTALDVYAAVALGVVVPLPPDDCPMHERVRHAFATLDGDVRAAASPALVAHRDLMYARHLPLPVQM
jgi:glutathione S-transferase